MNKELTSQFHFSPHDLSQNALGFITPVQQQLVAAHYKKIKKDAYISILLMLLISLVTLAFIALRTGWSGFLHSLPLLFVYFVLYLSLFLFPTIIKDYRYYRQWRKAPIIHSKSGYIQLSTGYNDYRYKGSEVYYIKIGKTKFKLMSKQQFDAFKKEREYTIYYMPGYSATLILSIKELP